MHSYPRLTLDFHTNKRIIDEVVSMLSTPLACLSSFLYYRLLSPLSASETRFLASQRT
jgi:hypothetical protein